jgi:endoglucanase
MKTRKSVEPWLGVFMRQSVHSKYTRRSGAAVGFWILAGTCLFSATAAWAQSQSVTIRGTQFYKDGQPWLPKGIKIEAFNEPAGLRAKNKIATEARSNWGDQEIGAIKSVFGADIARFAVSQPGLDPKSPIYDPAYREELLAAFKQARAAGLVVIPSMDAQAENGIEGLPCMPNDGNTTVRAWKELAPSLINDPGVMLELFDEPCGSTKPEERAKWVTGTQEIVNALRELGAKNILLVDGLHYARTTSGLTGSIHDPLPNRMAWAVHPYLSKGWFVTEDQWETNFGGEAAHFPTIASEWNATPTNGCVDETTPALSLRLMRYLQKKHIGLIGWAIDSHSGKLVKDHVSYQPTNYEKFSHCNDGTDSGGGELLAKFPHD